MTHSLSSKILYFLVCVIICLLPGFFFSTASMNGGTSCKKSKFKKPRSHSVEPRHHPMINDKLNSFDDSSKSSSQNLQCDNVNKASAKRFEKITDDASPQLSSHSDICPSALYSTDHETDMEFSFPMDFRITTFYKQVCNVEFLNGM